MTSRAEVAGIGRLGENARVRVFVVGVLGILAVGCGGVSIAGGKDGGSDGGAEVIGDVGHEVGAPDAVSGDVGHDVAALDAAAEAIQQPEAGADLGAEAGSAAPDAGDLCVAPPGEEIQWAAVCPGTDDTCFVCAHIPKGTSPDPATTPRITVACTFRYGADAAREVDCVPRCNACP